MVWPELLAEPDTKDSVMVPVFGSDMPGPEDLEGVTEREGSKTVVGFRMPYDLPLSPYKADDTPWCATMQYLEPDWMGMAWAGYGR